MIVTSHLEILLFFVIIIIVIAIIINSLSARRVSKAAMAWGLGGGTDAVLDSRGGGGGVGGDGGREGRLGDGQRGLRARREGKLPAYWRACGRCGGCARPPPSAPGLHHDGQLL